MYFLQKQRVGTYIYMYIHMYTNTCTCVYVDVHTYMCMYIRSFCKTCLYHLLFVPACRLPGPWQPSMGKQPTSQHAHMHAALAMAAQCGQAAKPWHAHVCAV